MIRILYLSRDGQVTFDLSLGKIWDALQDKEGLLWVDFEGEPPETCEPILRDTFGFHPLAVDDALQESHVPRIDDWVAYLYLVLPAVVFRTGKETLLETLELDAFLGPN